MARTKISEFSATAADNTDIDNIDIAEGCAPSGINNAIRELMAQLKDMQTGSSGDAFTFTTLTVTGDGAFTSTGSVKMPVGTVGQRPGTPAKGMLRFNDDVDKFEGYNGAAWASVGGGATGAGGDEIFVENALIVTTDYTLTASRNASSVGPISINSGVAVTVPSGARWVIL